MLPLDSGPEIDSHPNQKDKSEPWAYDIMAQKHDIIYDIM